MPTELVHRLDKGASRLAELDHAGLKVAQRSLNKRVLLFVVGQEIMPKGVLDVERLDVPN